MDFEFELGAIVAHKSKPELKMIVGIRTTQAGGQCYRCSWIDKNDKSHITVFYEPELQLFEPK